MSERTALRGSAAVLLVAYLAASFAPTLPEGAYDDAQVVGLLEGPDRTLLIVGGYLWVVAGIAALVFSHHLAGALAERAGTAGGFVRAAGTGYGVMLLAAGVLFTAVPMGSAVGELPGEAPVEIFRVLTQAGFYALLVPGLLCAAVMITAASIALRGTGPAWLAPTGFVIAPLCLLGFAWAPQFLVPLWAVALAAGVTDRAQRVRPTAQRA